MTFSPTLAAHRFGYGMSPTDRGPDSVDALLRAALGPDVAGQAIPIPIFGDAMPAPRDYVFARRAQMNGSTKAERDDGATAVRKWREDALTAGKDGALRTLARCVGSADGLRERLTAFWADHFTAVPRTVLYRHLVTPYIEEAIRPHVMGQFSDMLIAAATHPIMLLSLQQAESVGENSEFGARRGRGLNENLARELIELHTLGAGADYTQADVRQLAELLTGLTYHPVHGFRFRADRAEPGAESVLGRTYGPDPSIEVIKEVLTDLARHPATARHIARKLVVHFLSDEPDPNLVTQLAAVFIESDGDLATVVESLIRDPRSWDPSHKKVRQPFEFIASSLRCLGVAPEAILTATDQDVRRLLQRPLRVMGQPWQNPTGPDGWPESASHWVIPQAMAGRISWAMQAPTAIVPSLPDPREFVFTAFGEDAPQVVRFAASAAETRAEGVGVVLASPEFQRR